MATSSQHFTFQGTKEVITFFWGGRVSNHSNAAPPPRPDGPQGLMSTWPCAWTFVPGGPLRSLQAFKLRWSLAKPQKMSSSWVRMAASVLVLKQRQIDRYLLLRSRGLLCQRHPLTPSRVIVQMDRGSGGAERGVAGDGARCILDSGCTGKDLPCLRPRLTLRPHDGGQCSVFYK